MAGAAIAAVTVGRTKDWPLAAKKSCGTHVHSVSRPTPVGLQAAEDAWLASFAAACPDLDYGPGWTSRIRGTARRTQVEGRMRRAISSAWASAATRITASATPSLFADRLGGPIPGHHGTVTAVREVRRAARVAKHSDALAALARVGFVGFGITHLMLAWIAAQIAFGRPPTDGDQVGAFALLRERPLGTLLLALVGLGLSATAVWQALEAALGHTGEPPAAQLRERLISAGRALGYGLFAFYAVKLVLRPTAPSAATEKQQAAGSLLAAPGGRWLVGAIGVGVVAVGAGLAWYGLTRHFERHLRTESMTPPTRDALLLLGTVGYCAKAVAYAVAGVLVVTAAVQFDPSASRGLDAALRTLAQHPWGNTLLLAVAAGVAAFGLFAVTQARYREV